MLTIKNIFYRQFIDKLFVAINPYEKFLSNKDMIRYTIFL